MCKMNVVMTLKTGVSYILDCDLATFERDTSNRVLVPYKASMLINSKLRIHMIDWIFRAAVMVLLFSLNPCCNSPVRSTWLDLEILSSCCRISFS